MNEARKIVIIGPAHPLRGGLASYDERLAREFILKRYDTVIYTFSYQYPGFLFPGTTQYSSGPKPEGIDIRIKINSVNPINWWKVGNELQKLCPDIVVVRYWLPFMGPCLGTILRRIRKNGHTKIICIADNIQPHEGRPGDRIFTSYFIRPVHAFITMSDKVLRQLKSIAPAKPARFVKHPLYDNFGDIIPQEEARRFLKINAEDRVLLFFGFIRKYKGLDILLKAIQLLDQNKANKNLKLLIAGEFYEDKRKYDYLLNDPEISGHLLLHTHFIPDNQIKYYLCAADCTVQPYRNATQSGVTPLSYYFEIPMIVTNVGGLPSMVPDGEAGLVADPTPEAIAAKIEEFFTRGKKSFLPGLRKEKENYSWQKLVEAIIESADSASF